MVIRIDSEQAPVEDAEALHESLSYRDAALNDSKEARGAQRARSDGQLISRCVRAAMLRAFVERAR